MKITYLGHASLAIEVNGVAILVDPFISPNPLAAHIDIDSLKADFILLTHAHGDHVADVEAIAARTQATIVSNFEIADYYGKKGLNHHPMNHGGSWKFPFGTVKYVNAIHSSAFPDGTYGGNPGGFVIEAAGKSIYISGDTALTFDMKLIPLRTKLDLAVFPIGNNFTMDVADAAIAADFVECNKVLGIHFDTFGYITIDHEAAKKHFSETGKELILLPIGDSIEI
jgi:L-ascorbate metabolism protein UlaG (beta-lactamase superfamily)